MTILRDIMYETFGGEAEEITELLERSQRFAKNGTTGFAKTPLSKRLAKIASKQKQSVKNEEKFVTIQKIVPVITSITKSTTYEIPCDTPKP